jgi:hypothetical protein
MPEARDDAPELFHSIAADDEDFQRACTVVAAGSAVACCVAILNCRPPTFPTLTWAAVVLRSAQYLAATAVAGAIGLAIACHTLAQRPQVRRRRLVEHALMGWLFLPGIVLLDRSWPAWALPLFALAAAGMAVSLQLLSPRDFNEADPTLQPRDFATFYGTPITGFRPARAVTISLCAEGALALTGAESYRLAGLLLGAAMFLLLWHWSAEVQIQLRPHQRRLLATGVAGLSFLICLLVLMPWIRRYGEGIPVSAKTNMPAIAPPMPARAPFGSVILYPPAERVTRLYLPAPNALANLSRITKPLEIPFDGAYWYFESPDQDPGPSPHTAHGLPTDARINMASAAGGPLRMQAVQRLVHPIPYNCCSALQVAVTDADPAAGAIQVGIVLTDTASPKETSVSLGYQTVPGTESMTFGTQGGRGSNSLTRSVRFPLPPARRMRKFNRITVTIVPTTDPSRGAKAAVRGFTLQPK